MTDAQQRGAKEELLERYKKLNINYELTDELEEAIAAFLHHINNRDDYEKIE